jgi:5,10-methylene-tetrahydrofolate dehydrogenase/methenyl tetrahydrofolate cyclohydrolase
LPIIKEALKVRTTTLNQNNEAVHVFVGNLIGSGVPRLQEKYVAKLEGKIVLVTGAWSGIGEATAAWLATAVYKVYSTSRRGAQAGQRFAPAGIVDAGIPKNLQLDALTASPLPRP